MDVDVTYYLNSQQVKDNKDDDGEVSDDSEDGTDSDDSYDAMFDLVRNRNDGTMVWTTMNQQKPVYSTLNQPVCSM